VRNLSITFDDVELNDGHTANIIAVTGTDTAPTVAEYVGTFSTGFSDVATGAGDGTVTFEFEVADSVIDNLTEDETLIQRYEVQVEDDDGAIATRNIVITIVGTNDAPEITGILDSGGSTVTLAGLTLTEDSDIDATGATTTQNLTGTITFDDVDVNSLAAATGAADMHDVTAEVTGITLDTATFATTTDFDAILAGALTFDEMMANTTDTVANTADWSFDINDADFDFLADGEVLAITYTITVDDGRGR